MPPQTTEAASQEANQPTIISFLRPMFGIQGGQEQREEQDNQEDEQEDMDADSSRKRLRSIDEEDENVDGDNASQGNRVMSDSMIANTSIVVEPTPSRRRISSSTPTRDQADHQSTPDQSLTQQMREIREQILNSGINGDNGFDQEVIMRTDLSSHTANANTTAMMEGISRLTSQMIYNGNSLTWDNTGMEGVGASGGQGMVSPRPLPAIQEEPNRNIDQDRIAAVITNQLTSAVDSIKEVLKEEFAELAKSNKNEIQEIRSELININEELQSVINTAQVNSEEIVENKNLALTNESRIEALTASLQGTDDVAIQTNRRINDIADRINGQEEALFETRGDMDRMEQAIRSLQQAARSNASHGNPNIEALNNRITELENMNSKQEDTIAKLMKRAQYEEDYHFLRTIEVYNFRVPRPAAPSNMAREVLSGIDSQEIIAGAQQITFNPAKDNMRITFSNLPALHDAVFYLASCIKHSRSNGQGSAIRFRVMTPPRFAGDRRVLQRVGAEMKRNGLIDSYSFVVQGEKLRLKIRKRGSRDRIINTDPVEADAEQGQEEEAMEVANPPTCPLCIQPYMDSTNAIFHCGHVFHLSCLRVSMENDIRCPICRTPPGIEISQETLCNRCDHSAGIENMIISSKCGHLHTMQCHHSYLEEREVPIPVTVEAAEAMKENRQFQGCRSCSMGLPRRQMADEVMFLLRPNPEMPEFISIQGSRPTQRPRRHPDGAILTIEDLLPREGVASGANATPIGERRNRARTNRNRGTRQGDRSRSARR